MPVRPSSATPPGRVAVFSTSAPPDVLCSPGVDGDADDSTPAGLKTPEIVLPSAFTAPSPGSCWYMIRHVTPVAKAEIAIGRKTTGLNPTPQRIRSGGTAKLRPIAVTRAGATATPIALVLIPVVRVELGGDAVHVAGRLEEVLEESPFALSGGRSEGRRLLVRHVEHDGLRRSDRSLRRPRDRVRIDARRDVLVARPESALLCPDLGGRSGRAGPHECLHRPVVAGRDQQTAPHLARPC